VKDELREQCQFGAVFAVVSCCISFEGCKRLLGTGVAVLSTQKLEVSTGYIGQALSKMPQVWSRAVICFSRRACLVKSG